MIENGVIGPDVQLGHSSSDARMIARALDRNWLLSENERQKYANIAAEIALDPKTSPRTAARAAKGALSVLKSGEYGRSNPDKIATLEGLASWKREPRKRRRR